MDNALVFYSCTGACAQINQYYHSYFIDYKVINLTDYKTLLNFNYNINYNIIILTFPVHSQNVPINLKKWLQNIKVNHMIINIAYGCISAGNILAEINKLLLKKHVNLIGASVICTPHSYMDVNFTIGLQPLMPIIRKLKQGDYAPCRIKNHKANIFRKFFKRLRTQYNIKINYQSDLCNKCGKCQNLCPNHCLSYDFKFLNNCQRCLRCVFNCPNQALTFKRSKLLTNYLYRHFQIQTPKVYL